MPFEPQKITKQIVLDAVKKINDEHIELKDSTKYCVIIDGKEYPPKEIMRYAHEKLNGEKISPSGGETTNKYFRALGFEIVEKYKDPIKSIIEKYIRHISSTRLLDEAYKWDIVKRFTGRPDVNAKNFYDEIKSLKYNNLIYAMGVAVINQITKEKPEEIRTLFKTLFDDDIDLKERVKLFNTETLKLYREIGEKLQHHQDERSISTYLTFHNSQKYTFYKASFYKKYCQLLTIKEAPSNEKYAHYLTLIDELIENYIKPDNELINLVKSLIPEYYDGTNNMILAQDILYQMLDKNEGIKYWIYAPGENAEYWEEFYEQGIIGLGWDEIGDLNDYKTKKDLVSKLQELENTSSSKKNDATANYEFKDVVSIGDIIIVKKGRSELLGYGEVTSDYYYDKDRTYFQKCRKVQWEKKGIWNADHNLVLKTLTDITKYPSDSPEYGKYYERLLGIMNNEQLNDPIMANVPPLVKSDFNSSLNTLLYGPPGTGKTYNTLLKAAEIIEKREITDFSEAQSIFNVHLGNRIEFITFHQNYSYEDFIQGLRPDVVNKGNLAFERKDGVFTRIATNAFFEYYKIYSNRKRNLKQTDQNLDVNEVYLSFYNYLKSNPEKVFKTKTGSDLVIKSYSERKCLLFSHADSHVMHTVSGDRLINLFEHFPTIESIKNVHKDITEAIGGCNATVYWTALNEFIQFYKTTKNQRINIDEEDLINYEDISFEEKKEFLNTVNLLELSSIDSKDVPNYVIIIDEINRANISRVFGELITLIEPDKRSHGAIPLKCTLPSGDEFIVPSNLYIIGTMNTADKSIALLDIALRRRFEFEAMYPLYDIPGMYDVDILKKLNTKIIESKGYDFQIGHAYFMGDNNDLVKRMNKKVIPLLLEYYMNDKKEVTQLLKDSGLEVVENSWPLQISGTKRD